MRRTKGSQVGTEKLLQGLAKAIDEILNPGRRIGAAKNIGFCLLTYRFDDIKAGVNYVGNGDREDVKKSLTELLSRWDKPEDHDKMEQ